MSADNPGDRPRCWRARDEPKTEGGGNEGDRLPVVETVLTSDGGAPLATLSVCTCSSLRVGANERRMSIARFWRALPLRKHTAATGAPQRLSEARRI
jgi:hypothetical protein